MVRDGRRADSRRVLAAVLGALLVASAAMHVFLLLTTRGVVDDMSAYGSDAFAVTHGINIYAYWGGYPYPPVWIWIVWAMAQLSHAGIPFYITIKLPAIAADLVITVLLFSHEISRRGWATGALVAPALWALNPVPAIVAAGHGQFDSLPALCMVIAVLLLRRPGESSRSLAALALGVGISLKVYPVLLLPFLVFTAPRQSRLRVVALAFVPVLAAMAIYTVVAGYNPGMLTDVLGYRSSADLGYSAILRLFAVEPSRIVGMLIIVLATDVMVLWALTQSRIYPSRPDLAAAALFAAFYVVTPRGSVQYLVWGVPFMALAFRRLYLAFSAVAAVLLIGFYEFQFPTALPGVGAVGTLPGAGWVFLGGLFAVLIVGALCFWESWRGREVSRRQPELARAAKGAAAAAEA